MARRLVDRDPIRRITMLARLPFRSSPANVRGLFVCSLLALAPCGASATPALSPYVWPADGAPVCNGPGDQRNLFQSASGCNSMTLTWVGAESIEFGLLGPIPPTGECPGPESQVTATGVTEASAAEVRSNIIGIG